MSCTRHAVLVSLVTLVLLLIRASPVGAQAGSPDDKAKASARFQKGVELYKSGDIRAALIEFKRAYELAPTFHLLFNMGQASAELKDYVEAYESFTQYLEDGGSEVGSERRGMVKREIARLKTYLASLGLTVAVSGAEVQVDGVVVGVTPLTERILVSAGRRAIVVTHPGYARWERYIDLAGEDERTIDVELISLSPSQPEPPARIEKTRTASRGLGTAFWTSAAITAALGVGTGVSAALLLGAESDYDRELAKVPNTRGPIERAGDRVKRYALTTDIGVGLTAAGAIVTVVLALRAGGEDSTLESPSVGLVIGPGNVAISGRF